MRRYAEWRNFHLGFVELYFKNSIHRLSDIELSDCKICVPYGINVSQFLVIVDVLAVKYCDVSKYVLPIMMVTSWSFTHSLLLTPFQYLQI